MSDRGLLLLVLPPGEWQNDKRHGFGICKFADGTKFKGEWEADAWVQSLADAHNSKASGPGLARAVAGAATTFEIKVCTQCRHLRCAHTHAFQSAKCMCMLTGRAMLAVNSYSLS